MLQIRHIFFFGLPLVGSPTLLHAWESADGHQYVSKKFFIDAGVFPPSEE